MIYWEGFGSVRGLFEGGERNFASSRKKKKKVGRAPEIPVVCLMVVNHKYWLALLDRECAACGTEDKFILYMIFVGEIWSKLTAWKT